MLPTTSFLLLLLLLLLPSTSSFSLPFTLLTSLPPLPTSGTDLGNKLNTFYDTRISQLSETIPALTPSSPNEIPQPVYSELPSTSVPIILTLFLIAGIGILTTSLGDVVGEEAMTGDRAGLKARGEADKRKRKFLDTGKK
ncbi:hypothetical protein TrVE_jg8872 [Triparma verrucosa]|uniref:Uncharacterized protein n=1 Tax=Triparma verrucosa TaxID=1606542 RepID=A0A9W7F046_9STRA|nr:hypothetical protein TrVE_jg8872 [Triparma verrucosa]